MKAIIAALCLFATPVFAQSGPPFAVSVSSIWVKDGDTFYYGSREVRFRGWNAPEISYPKCLYERNLAYASKNRFIDIVRSGAKLTLQFEKNDPTNEVWPSLYNVPRQTAWTCGYNRLCGRLFANGVDIGAILTSEGLAAPYCLQGAPCEPLTNWCGG